MKLISGVCVGDLHKRILALDCGPLYVVERAFCSIKMMRSKYLSKWLGIEVDDFVKQERGWVYDYCKRVFTWPKYEI